MRTDKKPRCPYCILGAEFRVMRVLGNGRQICEHCGHIIFPQDRAFWCPRKKCVDVHFSLKYSRFFSIRPRLNMNYYESGEDTIDNH
jgi:hypothetical protein